MTQQTVVAPPPSAPPSYEFSKTENSTISRTATWAKALSVMFFITTCVQVVNLNILGILVDLAIGITFWKAATLLDSVVNTEDDDVPNMLGALAQLQTAFTIRIIITAIAAAIGLVVSVGFFVQYEFLEEAVVESPAVTVDDADEAEEADESEAEEEAENEDAAPEEAADAAPAVEGAADTAPGAEGDAAPGADAVPAGDAAPAAAGDTPPA
ncbi:MAG: hypothetical protein KUG77_12235 [Nannocystaceae bacterium]|nr:hypothetical protein [Nannocystaceae bacterium]